MRIATGMWNAEIFGIGKQQHTFSACHTGVLQIVPVLLRQRNEALLMYYSWTVNCHILIEVKKVTDKKMRILNLGQYISRTDV